MMQVIKVIMSKWITNTYESFEAVYKFNINKTIVLCLDSMNQELSLFCCTKVLRNQLDTLDLHMSVYN